MYSAISFSSSSDGKSPHGEIGKHKGLKILAFNYVVSSSLTEGTKQMIDKIVRETTRSLQSVYDNVYDMIPCIRLTKIKGSGSATNY